MPLSQSYIDGATPLGATLVYAGSVIALGATFKVWAPAATAVYLNGVFNGVSSWNKDADATMLMVNHGGYWTGYASGAREGDLYKFYVVGPVGGTVGYKRDPYAREFTHDQPFPTVNCIIRDGTYPWHDVAFAVPDFSDMIVYQLHIGVYNQQLPPGGGCFLDIISKIEYLVALGVNVLQPLPVVEFEENSSLGYDGTDYFAPEMLYGTYDLTALAGYLVTINRLLQQKGFNALALSDIANGPKQLKALVDLCHIYGIAVVFDVVYNHAGGFTNDDESIYFYDRQTAGNQNNSLYFTDKGWAGGLSFALWNNDVRQYLINNATFYLNEYHVDGFRYDEISVLLNLNGTAGWTFCNDLTNTIRYAKNRVLQNAEHWPVDPAITRPVAQGGAGFDVIQHDGLRIAIRTAIQSASAGQDALVSMDAIANNLCPQGFPHAWMAVTCVENHDIVKLGQDLRIPALADGANHRSFYARSRAKVATGLLLTSPGIPQLFMGQEFLEDKQWSDDPSGANRLYWQGLASGDKAMVDELRFTQDIIRLRWAQPALRGESINVFHCHNSNRIIAFHRWIEGQGRDVVIVASLNDNALYHYNLGFPRSGNWSELFNSDVYDNWVNPLAVGNGGGIYAQGSAWDGLPASAAITIPPRALLVFGLQ